MISKLFRNDLLEKAIDVSWKRNETISNNIANVDTPGYKRKSVKFEEFLDQERKDIPLKTSDSRHIGVEREYPVKIVTDNSSSSYRLDGNNVDIESEMVSMAKNTIKYNVLIQSINSRFRRLTSVINEGRR